MSLAAISDDELAQRAYALAVRAFELLAVPAPPPSDWIMPGQDGWAPTRQPGVFVRVPRPP